MDTTTLVVTGEYATNSFYKEFKLLTNEKGKRNNDILQQ